MGGHGVIPFQKKFVHRDWPGDVPRLGPVMPFRRQRYGRGLDGRVGGGLIQHDTKLQRRPGQRFGWDGERCGFELAEGLRYAEMGVP